MFSMFPTTGPVSKFVYGMDEVSVAVFMTAILSRSSCDRSWAIAAANNRYATNNISLSSVEQPCLSSHRARHGIVERRRRFLGIQHRAIRDFFQNDDD